MNRMTLQGNTEKEELKLSILMMNTSSKHRPGSSEGTQDTSPAAKTAQSSTTPRQKISSPPVPAYQSPGNVPPVSPRDTSGRTGECHP